MLQHLCEKLFAVLGKKVYNRPWITLSASLVIFVILASGISKLKLEANLAALLPDNHPVVKTFHEVEKIYGGLGSLILVFRATEFDPLEKFVLKLIPVLKAHPEVALVEFEKPVQFFEKNMLLYADEQDLEKLYTRINNKIEYERQKSNPLLLDLMEDPGLEVSDIKEKYIKKLGIEGREFQHTDRYYYNLKEEDTGEKLHTIAVFLKPQEAATNVAYNRRLVADIDSVVRPLIPKESGITLELTGRYMKSVVDFGAMENDMKVVTLFSIGGIFTVLFLAFRRFRGVLIILTTLLMAIIATLGFVGHYYGQLNLITSFLVAILMGLGIDFGIHLLLRYTNEQRTGKAAKESFFLMYSQTGAASFTSALTTALAFYGLSFTSFRAFIEFGTIAATGIVFIFFFMMTTFSSLLALTTRSTGLQLSRSRLYLDLPEPLFKHPKYTVLATFMLFLAAVLLANSKLRFDYNFSKIQSLHHPVHKLDTEINAMLGRSQNPSVVLTDDLEHEKAILEALESYIESNKENKEMMIDRVVALKSFVPENQAQKLKTIERLAALLKKNRKNLPLLDQETQENWKLLESKLEVTSFNGQGLPKLIRHNFIGKEGYENRRVVLIFPFPFQDSGKKDILFSNQLKEINLADGRGIQAASDEVIFAEILQLIEKDGLLIISLTVLAVFLVVSLNFSSIREGAIISMPLVVALGLKIGMLSLLDHPLDFFNIIMFPIIIGIGVDSSIHLYHRFRETDDIFIAAKTTGGAILLSSFTSIIGFGSLILASNDAMRSMGIVAVLGIAIFFMVALIVLPSSIMLLQKKPKPTVQEKS